MKAVLYLIAAVSLLIIAVVLFELTSLAAPWIWQ